MIFPRISLTYKLVPVQYREYEHGLSPASTSLFLSSVRVNKAVVVVVVVEFYNRGCFPT